MKPQYDMIKYSSHYCKIDVHVLKEGWRKFRNLILDKYQLDTFQARAASAWGAEDARALVDRLFTPLRAQRVLLDACFSAIGRRRALFVVLYDHRCARGMRGITE